ncbi:hypothetical protein [Chitinophaga sp. 212800010-3]|uniref:hypothetical protein n=1 Tax=Chitinophaga sp. 212800010-3 TaxID=3101735 RepID=UPI002E143044
MHKNKASTGQKSSAKPRRKKLSNKDIFMIIATVIMALLLVAYVVLYMVHYSRLIEHHP